MATLNVNSSRLGLTLHHLMEARSEMMGVAPDTGVLSANDLREMVAALDDVIRGVLGAMHAYEFNADERP